MPPPDIDVYLVSYPKSGRTWLRIMLGQALCLRHGLDSKLALQTAAVTAIAGVLRTDVTHDETDLRYTRHFASLSSDKSRFADKKVIFLTRDVRDVVVSNYFEATRRRHLFPLTVEFEGTLSDFVRSPAFGVRKVAAFYEAWERNRDVPRDFLRVRYEDLHAAPAESLRRVLRFVGADSVDREIVARAVAFASFGNMRRLEEGNFFDHACMRPGDPSDPDSYKVRRGRVGGYKDYLSDADLAYIELVLRSRFRAAA